MAEQEQPTPATAMPGVPDPSGLREPWWRSKSVIAFLGTLAASVGPAMTTLHNWREVELARASLAAGAELVFLSAGSEEIARVYAQVGFYRVGTACIAEGASS